MKLIISGSVGYMEIICNNPKCSYLKIIGKPFTLWSENPDDINPWKELIPKKAIKCIHCGGPMDFSKLNGGSKLKK